MQIYLEYKIGKNIKWKIMKIQFDFPFYMDDDDVDVVGNAMFVRWKLLLAVIPSPALYLLCFPASLYQEIQQNA